MPQIAAAFYDDQFYPLQDLVLRAINVLDTLVRWSQPLPVAQFLADLRRLGEDLLLLP